MRKRMESALAAWREPGRDASASRSHPPESDKVIRFERPSGDVVLPALRARRLRDWTERYAFVTGRPTQEREGPAALTAYGGTLSEHSAAIASLVLDYDRSGVLGGLDHFRRTWTNDDAYRLLELIVESHRRR